MYDGVSFANGAIIWIWSRETKNPSIYWIFLRENNAERHFYWMIDDWSTESSKDCQRDAVEHFGKTRNWHSPTRLPKISWKYIQAKSRIVYGKLFHVIFAKKLWLQIWATHCGNYGIFLSPKKISSNQLYSNLYSITVTFTKFLPKMGEWERIPVISTLCNNY